MVTLKQQVEALLFSSSEPVSLNKFQSVLNGTKSADIQATLMEIRSDCQERAYTLEEIAGGYQLLTRPEFTDIIGLLNKTRSNRRLSAAASETLAIIAYKQPIKRADIEAIRGVQSGEIIRALMERGLVRITGKENVSGSPVLYGTSDDFLNAFGLANIKDLPKPEEVQ